MNEYRTPYGVYTWQTPEKGQPAMATYYLAFPDVPAGQPSVTLVLTSLDEMRDRLSANYNAPDLTLYGPTTSEYGVPCWTYAPYMATALGLAWPRSWYVYEYEAEGPEEAVAKHREKVEEKRARQRQEQEAQRPKVVTHESLVVEGTLAIEQVWDEQLIWVGESMLHDIIQGHFLDRGLVEVVDDKVVLGRARITIELLSE